MTELIKNLVEAETKRGLEYYISLLGGVESVALLSQIWNEGEKPLKILEKLGQLDFGMKYEQYSKLSPAEIYKLGQLSILAEIENISQTNRHKD